MALRALCLQYCPRMIVYSFLVFTLLIACVTVGTLLRATRKGIANGWSGVLLAISMAVFIYLYGAWVYVSVYLKYVFAICLAAMLFARLWLHNKATLPQTKTYRHILNISGVIVFGSLCVLYFTGTTGKPVIANLRFPMKAGNYFVLQGGKGLPANFFHKASYAMDIVKLDSYGRRANNIFSTRLNDYYIFNDTVYSPCNGLVVNVRNDNPDNIPPSRRRGPHNLNAVLIDAGDYYVFLGHFKKGSVIVQEGDSVVTGQPLALAGNSGSSLEPHLHIQANRKTAGVPWYRSKPLYMSFDGKTYLLFEIIRPGRISTIH